MYTVIDPRKPLPEAVNAQFESGEVFRITVSSPWLPSLCSHCRQVGHTISKCPSAPPKCPLCNSVKHEVSSCPRNNTEKNKENRNEKRNGKAPIQSQLPIILGTGNAPLISDSDPKSGAGRSRKPGHNPSKQKKVSAQWVRTENQTPLPVANREVVGCSSSQTPLFVRPPATEHEKAMLCVDLRSNLFDGVKQSTAQSSASSASDSDPDPDPDFSSNDEGSLDEDRDRFITVISN